MNYVCIRLLISAAVLSLVEAFNVTFVVCMTSSTGLAYSYGYFGPAIEMAVDDLNEMYPRIHFREVNVSPKKALSCPDLDRTTVDTVMHYFYRDPAGIQLIRDPKSLIVLVGNGCSDSLRVMGDIAREMNIALIASGGSNTNLNDHKRYPTIFRLLPYQQAGLVNTLLSFLKKYHWRDIVLMCDTREDLGNFEQLACDGWEAGVKNSPGRNIVPYRFDTLKNKVDFRYYLNMAKQSSRVILVVAHGNTTRDILIEANRMGMTNGEYVYITTYPEQHPLYGYYRWQAQDGRDDDAKTAFQSLYFISLRPLRGPSYTEFEVDIKYRTYKTQHYLYEPNEAVSAFTALQYTVVRVTGDLINETVPDGDLDLTTDFGAEIVVPSWKRRTISSITGDFDIINGDREVYTYVIVAMNHSSHDFMEVYSFDTVNNNLNPVLGHDITWAFRDDPPPNRPKCGFDGQDPVCYVSGGSIAGIAIGISVILVLLAPVSYYIIKHTRNDELNADRWNIPAEEITFPNNNRAKSSLSHKAHGQSRTMSTGKSMTSSTMNGTANGTRGHVSSVMNSTNVAMFKGVPVWVHRIPVRHKFEPSSKEEKLIKKMKTTTSANLTRLYGFTVVDGDLGVICEVVRRGSLLDVMLSESINFDAALRISAVLDITKGLSYLHASTLQYHAFLSSMTCLIDSRFVVKLAYHRLDFLPRFLPDLSQENPLHRRYFTLAPEQLRSGNIFHGSKEGDIYAYGHLIVQILNGEEPFQSEMEVDHITPKGIIDRIIRPSVVPFRPKMPETGLLTPIKMLVEKCWDDRPVARPTIEYINKLLISVPGFEKESNFVDDLLKRLGALTQVLEARIELATRDTMEEKKKSDELLFQVLPKHVANALTQGEKIDPEAFASVTIGFTAIEDFTDIAFSSTPLQLVNLLNNLYTLFDATLQLYDVYKVETISDSYMIASGLPVRNGHMHSSEVAKLALSLMDSSKTFTSHNSKARTGPLQLKIGFHTGGCVAGIIGHKMPRYCLFGDTINTASRMTSSGHALKIQVSLGAMEHLQTHSKEFRFDLRGIVEIKGKGPQKCYWLLQEHEQSLIPPDA